MPWEIKKKGSQHCVVKQTTGEEVTCHPTRAAALRHLKALYANVPEARHGVEQLESATRLVEQLERLLKPKRN